MTHSSSPQLKETLVCKGKARLCSLGPQRHSSPVYTHSATLLSMNDQIPDLQAKRVPANGDMQVAPTGYHVGIDGRPLRTRTCFCSFK